VARTPCNYQIAKPARPFVSQLRTSMDAQAQKQKDLPVDLPFGKQRRDEAGCLSHTDGYLDRRSEKRAQDLGQDLIYLDDSRSHQKQLRSCSWLMQEQKHNEISYMRDAREDKVRALTRVQA